MEISRKNYSNIIGILKKKSIDADIAIELADSICELLEKESYSGNALTPKTPDFDPNTFYSGSNTLSGKSDTTLTLNEDVPALEKGATKRREYKPGEKVPGGVVNSQGVFTPLNRSFAGNHTAEEKELLTQLNG